MLEKHYQLTPPNLTNKEPEIYRGKRLPTVRLVVRQSMDSGSGLQSAQFRALATRQRPFTSYPHPHPHMCVYL